MRQKPHILAPILVTAIVSAGLLSCVGHSERLTMEQTIPAAGADSLEVRTSNGSIHIRTGSTDQIEMVARYKASSERKKPPVRIRRDGNTIAIDARDDTHGLRIFPFFRNRSSVSLDLVVPARFALEVRNVNGSIHVKGTAGAMQLTSVNGAIEVETPRAEVTAKTVNGHIRADFLEEFRGARLKTVNGSVRISVPPNASLAVDVQQVNGSFRSNVPVTVNAGGSGSGGEFPLEVTTVNGSVTLHEREEKAAPATSSANVTLK
ncbi:MAG: DUF4097 family beta strand repeat-containing protein [Thermoanaerobaculia bacterium]